MENFPTPPKLYFDLQKSVLLIFGLKAVQVQVQVQLKSYWLASLQDSPGQYIAYFILYSYLMDELWSSLFIWPILLKLIQQYWCHMQLDWCIDTIINLFIYFLKISSWHSDIARILTTWANGFFLYKIMSHQKIWWAMGSYPGTSNFIILGFPLFKLQHCSFLKYKTNKIQLQ